jgi:hypothetical protein
MWVEFTAAKYSLVDRGSRRDWGCPAPKEHKFAGAFKPRPLLLFYSGKQVQLKS